MPPELEAFELDTDLAAVSASLDRGGMCATFTLPSNRFHVHKGKARDKTRRRGIKKLIRPENAAAAVALLPEHPDDRVHCVLRGDFVLCDIIPLILSTRGCCPHLRIATLGLSAANAAALVALQGRGLIGKITLVVSHYFEQIDKATTFRQVRSILEGRCRLIITRSHAKVILIPTEQGDHFVIEGSANLRSSDNLEQMLIVNDADTHAFHADWIEALNTHG